MVTFCFLFSAFKNVRFREGSIGFTGLTKVLLDAEMVKEPFSWRGERT